jgi:hypothetical protein
MSTAEIFSLAALIISAGTLLTAIVRFRHERQIEDRRDARSILAEAAFELGRMKGVMKDTLTKFEKALTGREPWPSDTKELINAMEAAEEALDSALAAVRIRFAQGDEVVTRLESAHDSARGALITYWMAAGTDPDEDHSEYAEALDCGKTFDAQKDAYLIAAQKAVGVKLALYA